MAKAAEAGGWGWEAAAGWGWEAAADWDSEEEGLVWAAMDWAVEGWGAEKVVHCSQHRSSRSCNCSNKTTLGHSG